MNALEELSGRLEYLAYLEAAVEDAGFVVKHDGGSLGDSNFRLEPKLGTTAAPAVDVETLRALSDRWANDRSYTGSPVDDIRALIEQPTMSTPAAPVADASTNGGSDALRRALAEYPSKNTHQMQARKVCAGVLALAESYGADPKLPTNNEVTP